MIIAPRPSRRLIAAAFFFALSSAAIAALEPAGSIPGMFLSGGAPSAIVETVNDSKGVCAGRVETDDRRSFGLRAYASWRDLAFAVACDGFTFRGTTTSPGSRSDELSITTAWMDDVWEGDSFVARAGVGAGARAWGDFGFMALQGLWHDVLGVSRPYPTRFNEGSLRPFAYTGLDAVLRPSSPVSAEVSIRELFLGSGAIESSMTLLAASRAGLSENWAGLSWQGRLGNFDANDASVNEYEAGPWIVAGARTGLLYVESSINLATNFAIGSISLRFGDLGGRGGAGLPRQELAVGTSFLQSQLSTSRFVALGLRGGGDLRLGIETIEGVSRWLWNDLGNPHFQEASAAAEFLAPRWEISAAPRPFAGAAIGARQETLSVADLERSELFDRASGFLCKVYAGLRILDFPLPGADRGAMALDLAGGLSFMTGSYHPPEATLIARIAVRD